MNKRHEHLSKQVQKETRKEVKSGVYEETPRSMAKEKLPLPKAHRTTKKTAKRTSPSEKITDSAPSHPHKEGSRWTTMLQRQMEENNLRMQKQEQKR